MIIAFISIWANLHTWPSSAKHAVMFVINIEMLDVMIGVPWEFLLHKVDNPYPVTFLWGYMYLSVYVVWCHSSDGYPKKKCVQKRLHCVLITLDYPNNKTLKIYSNCHHEGLQS